MNCDQCELNCVYNPNSKYYAEGEPRNVIRRIYIEKSIKYAGRMLIWLADGSKGRQLKNRIDPQKLYRKTEEFRDLLLVLHGKHLDLNPAALPIDVITKCKKYITRATVACESDEANKDTLRTLETKLDTVIPNLRFALSYPSRQEKLLQKTRDALSYLEKHPHNPLYEKQDQIRFVHDELENGHVYPCYIVELREVCNEIFKNSH